MPLNLLFGQAHILTIEHFGVEDGLSHREVNALYQDEEGVIWIGTRQGLNRFDGYEFELISKEKDGLSSNHIGSIVPDADGLIWLFQQYPQPSIDLYDPFERRVIALADKFPEALPFNLDQIWGRGLLTGAPGHLFFRLTDKRTVIHYHPSTGIETIPLPANLPEINSFNISPSNEIWLLFENHTLAVYDLRGREIRRWDRQQFYFSREVNAQGFILYAGTSQYDKQQTLFVDWLRRELLPVPKDRWVPPKAGYPSECFSA
ncbi:MAG: hypothetical protein KDC44_03410, partial [Phaeodactylibacter sp.]|nr:hypothetical protein [Phaeodactylibacter sp.]